MGGLGREMWVLGAHKVVKKGESQPPGGLNRGSNLEAAGAQGMGLGARRMSHLEHLGPARKDTKRFGDRLRKRRNQLSLRTKLGPAERPSEIITREENGAEYH